MGRTTTPTFRVEIDGRRMAWNHKDSGRATDANLERFVIVYAKSHEADGVNEHISLSLGHVPYPTTARIVRQATGATVASWTAGAFQVW